MAFCNKCGSVLNSDGITCPRCSDGVAQGTTIIQAPYAVAQPQPVYVYQQTPAKPKGNGLGKAITSLVMSIICTVLSAIAYSAADEAYLDYIHYINNYQAFGGLEYGFGGVATIFLMALALPFYIVGLILSIKAILGYFGAKKKYGTSGVATLVIGAIALSLVCLCTFCLGYSLWAMLRIF